MFKQLLKDSSAIVDNIIYVIVGLILLIGVSIPISTQVISSSNLTGLTATIVGFIPVFLGIAGLVLVANIIRG